MRSAGECKEIEVQGYQETLASGGCYLCSTWGVGNFIQSEHSDSQEEDQGDVIQNKAEHPC